MHSQIYPRAIFPNFREPAAYLFTRDAPKRGAARLSLTGSSAVFALTFLATFVFDSSILHDCDAHADTQFKRFVERLWPAARRKGVSRTTFNAAFNGVTPDPAHFKISAQSARIRETHLGIYGQRGCPKNGWHAGRKCWSNIKKVLDAIEAVYGVKRHYVVAIWGMESAYGKNTGTRDVVRSLATLAYRGRRRRFGRTQLLAALRILQRGDIAPREMRGSWAGAMGHTQFIPTTYNAYAVDFDGDRKRNIWKSIPDALGSTANYLRRSRWRQGETWGYEVKLPRGFNYKLAGKRRKMSVRKWASLGVKRASGKSFPRSSDRASLIIPAGARGPAFLIVNNFRSIMRYNNSVAYALAVGHLADRLMGYGDFIQPWPKDDRPLARSQRKKLQELLVAKGYETGGVDGVIGTRTLEAVRAFQKAKGLPVDGKCEFASTQTPTTRRIAPIILQRHVGVHLVSWCFFKILSSVAFHKIA